MSEVTTQKTTAEEIQNALETVYTSSNGKRSRLAELPLAYLRNIHNKLTRPALSDPALAKMREAVGLVIEKKAVSDMQNRGEA